LDFIALHFGEPDLGTPAFIVEAGVRALREGALFYESNSGRADLKEALCEYHRRRGVALAPEQVLITCGGVQAILVAMLGLLAPGDEMINVTPAWPNFQGGAELAGARVHDLALSFEPATRRFRLDFGALERLAARLPRLRLISVASPANPTGWVATAEEKARLLRFCRERRLWLLGDEMYDRIVFEGDGRPSFAALREAGDRLVVINGFSKTYCMTGWRLGYLLADPALVARLAQMQEYIVSCAPSMAQVAAITALREGEPFVAESLARYRLLRGIVLERLAAIPGAEGAEPAGGFYCFARLPGGEDSVRFCRALLETTGVITAPGRAFGAGGEGWVRLCFAQRPAVLEEALGRIAAYLAARRANPGQPGPLGERP
jgi:aspartate/methionine/tyrosine aminotransferase